MTPPLPQTIRSRHTVTLTRSGDSHPRRPLLSVASRELSIRPRWTLPMRSVVPSSVDGEGLA